jgi:hypothetical protein
MALGSWYTVIPYIANLVGFSKMAPEVTQMLERNLPYK